MSFENAKITCEQGSPVPGLNALKGTAFSAQAVKDYLSSNLAVLGIHVADNAGSDCHINASFENMNWDEKAKSAWLGFSVKVNIAEYAPYSEEASSLFHQTFSRTRHVTVTQMFSMDFDEWRFLTCELFSFYLNDGFGSVYRISASKMEAVLEHFLPLHFPGLTFDKFKMLHESGLFPCDENGLYAPEVIGPMLVRVAAGEDVGVTLEKVNDLDI